MQVLFASLVGSKLGTFPLSPAPVPLALLVLLILIGTEGCTTTNRYKEVYPIKNLNVVFVDQETLHEEWKSRTGRNGVQLMSVQGNMMPLVKTLRGYYDFSTNTLYCPKWDFAVCGHELHHAALGHFHESE